MATDYHGVSAGYRNYVFVILMLMFTLANIDRSILSILVEPIKREYGLSDTQIGTLTGLAFAVPLSLVLIPNGVLADRVNRIRLVSILILVRSSLPALTGLAQPLHLLLPPQLGFGQAQAGPAPTLPQPTTPP